MDEIMKRIKEGKGLKPLGGYRPTEKSSDYIPIFDPKYEGCIGKRNIREQDFHDGRYIYHIECDVYCRKKEDGGKDETEE